VTNSIARWADQLEAWALPESLLAAAEESPYGWSQKIWKRRSEATAHREPGGTLQIVRDILDSPAEILDIGVGRGRASLPLVMDGHRLHGVDESSEMLAGFVEDAATAGVAVETTLGRWPDVASEVAVADVVIAANVVYNVADIAPFLDALVAHARRAVVIELTEEHPWAHLTEMYRSVHGIDRPEGPTADDLIDVVRDQTGIEPVVHRWERPGQVWFESWEELTDHYGRRLVVPVADRLSLRPVLAPHVIEIDGRLHVGTDATGFVTVVLPIAMS
jgi:SAM-dependent methyltransferase